MNTNEKTGNYSVENDEAMLQLCILHSQFAQFDIAVQSTAIGYLLYFATNALDFLLLENTP